MYPDYTQRFVFCYEWQKAVLSQMAKKDSGLYAD